MAGKLCAALVALALCINVAQAQQLGIVGNLQLLPMEHDQYYAFCSFLQRRFHATTSAESGAN